MITSDYKPLGNNEEYSVLLECPFCRKQTHMTIREMAGIVDHWRASSFTTAFLNRSAFPKIAGEDIHGIILEGLRYLRAKQLKTK